MDIINDTATPIYIETLATYAQGIEDCISGKDVTKMALELNCSKSTIYTYLNGGIPNNEKAKEFEQKLLVLVKEILNRKKKNLIELML